MKKKKNVKGFGIIILEDSTNKNECFIVESNVLKPLPLNEPLPKNSVLKKHTFQILVKSS